MQVAGPGFINFYIKDETWKNTLKKIEDEGKDYGRLRIGENRKVQVEFVSANPTGPLTVGHGRGGVIGDVLANLLQSLDLPEGARVAVQTEKSVEALSREVARRRAAEAVLEHLARA